MCKSLTDRLLERINITFDGDTEKDKKALKESFKKLLKSEPDEDAIELGRNFIRNHFVQLEILLSGRRLMQGIIDALEPSMRISVVFSERSPTSVLVRKATDNKGQPTSNCYTVELTLNPWSATRSTVGHEVEFTSTVPVIESQCPDHSVVRIAPHQSPYYLTIAHELIPNSRDFTYYKLYTF